MTIFLAKPNATDLSEVWVSDDIDRLLKLSTIGGFTLSDTVMNFDVIEVNATLSDIRRQCNATGAKDIFGVFDCDFMDDVYLVKDILGSVNVRKLGSIKATIDLKTRAVVKEVGWYSKSIDFDLVDAVFDSLSTADLQVIGRPLAVGESGKPSKRVEWDPEFTPCYTPFEMLEQGVFEGKYINKIKEAPVKWKKLDRVVGLKDGPNIALNRFGIKSRLSLSEWEKRGWIMTDKEGWFGWYIRYWFGRRLGEEDTKQINRWKSFCARHQAQVDQSDKPKDLSTRPKQRQALLQWGWDSTKSLTDKQRANNIARLQKDFRQHVFIDKDPSDW